MQVCVDGRWRELCNSDWGNQEAFVVCRQLGLPATGECDMTQCSDCYSVLMHFYCSRCSW